MRKDMSKILTDRGRSMRLRRAPAPHIKGATRDNADDIETGPSHSPMRDRREDRKERMLNVSPLYRFLQSRLGKHWKTIFSELCGAGGPRSNAGYILRRELSWLVQDDPADVTYSFQHFYVHTDGTLKYRGYERHRRGADPQKVFPVDGKLYHRHSGIWYEVSMQEVEAYCVAYNDAILGTITAPKDSETMRPEWRWPIFVQQYGLVNGKVQLCAGKRSANKKEIAKIRKAFPDM
jgi:hypothetical protein